MTEVLRDASRDPRAGRDALPGAGVTRRVCAWCKLPIPPRARRDSVCCSTRCRQARHRFGRDVGAAAVASGHPLRLAYADPPYPGNAYLYRGHPDHAGEVDHVELIGRLQTYDGWALSTSAAALPLVLGICATYVRRVRVAAWVKGVRTNAAGRWPQNAWEPVVYAGGRPVVGAARVDALVHGVSPMTTLPTRVIGAKPATFSRWMFDLLGAQAGDTLDDMFPGSGAVARAWEAFTRRVDPLDASSTVAEHDASAAAVRDASRSPALATAAAIMI